MNVADLQRFIGDLARLLAATESKKTAAELERVVEGLDPFKAFTIADFAGFLPRAETYHRTGVLPVVPSKKPPTPRAPKPPKIGLDELRAEVKRVYETAGSAEVTFELIDGLRPKLDKLTKGDLVIVAEEVGLVGMSKKTKGVILDAILERIRSIKNSAVRTSIIDRPGTSF